MNGPLLQGDLVLLRPLAPAEDAAAWYEVMRDEEMHRWTGNTVPEDVEEVRQMLHMYADHPDIIAWAVAESAAPETIIGTYWIVTPADEKGRRIIHDEAQRIARRCWRQGHTRAARALVYRHAFETLGVDEIHAHAWARNIASCRSMERSGFELVESTLELFKKQQKVYSQRHYVLKKATWLRDQNDQP